MCIKVVWRRCCPKMLDWGNIIEKFTHCKCINYTSFQCNREFCKCEDRSGTLNLYLHLPIAFSIVMVTPENQIFLAKTFVGNDAIDILFQVKWIDVRSPLLSKWNILNIYELLKYYETFCNVVCSIHLFWWWQTLF